MTRPGAAQASALLFIAVVTAVSFYPAFSNGWTFWDDNVYVTDNPVVQQLSADNIRAVFTSKVYGQYIPLTMISYMIDYRVNAFDPAVFHTTNILIHILNSCLLFLLIHRLSGSMVAALIAGVLFGIHPMRVEPVAWISGRKDLLSAFFFLLASLSYLSFLSSQRKTSIVLAFFLFTAAILSKVTILMFPLVLLLYDYHQERKFSKAVIMEKIPFIAVAGILAAAGYFGQQEIAAMRSASAVSENIIVSLYSLGFYLEKFIVPVGLSYFYPFPPTLIMLHYGYALSVILLAVAAVKYVKDPKVIFGLLFFIVMLLPVLQLIRFSKIAAADRFTYLAFIGLFYIAGIMGVKLQERIGKRVFVLAAAVIVLLLSYGTMEQCRIWKDNASLWNSANP